MVDIHIIEEFVQNRRCAIIKNSKEEEKFISELTETIRKIDTSYLENKESLEFAIQEFARSVDCMWQKYSKSQNIPKLGKMKNVKQN